MLLAAELLVAAAASVGLPSRVVMTLSAREVGFVPAAVLLGLVASSSSVRSIRLAASIVRGSLVLLLVLLLLGRLLRGRLVVGVAALRRRGRGGSRGRRGLLVDHHSLRRTDLLHLDWRLLLILLVIIIIVVVIVILIVVIFFLLFNDFLHARRLFDHSGRLASLRLGHHLLDKSRIHLLLLLLSKRLISKKAEKKAWKQYCMYIIVLILVFIIVLIIIICLALH